MYTQKTKINSECLCFYMCTYMCVTVAIKEKEAIRLRVGDAQEELEEEMLVESGGQ